MFILQFKFDFFWGVVAFLGLVQLFSDDPINNRSLQTQLSTFILGIKPYFAVFNWAPYGTFWSFWSLWGFKGVRARFKSIFWTYSNRLSTMVLELKPTYVDYNFGFWSSPISFLKSSFHLKTCLTFFALQVGLNKGRFRGRLSTLIQEMRFSNFFKKIFNFFSKKFLFSPFM